MEVLPGGLKLYKIDLQNSIVLNWMEYSLCQESVLNCKTHSTKMFEFQQSPRTGTLLSNEKLEIFLFICLYENGGVQW